MTLSLPLPSLVLALRSGGAGAAGGTAAAAAAAAVAPGAGEALTPVSAPPSVPVTTMFSTAAATLAAARAALAVADPYSTVHNTDTVNSEARKMAAIANYADKLGSNLVQLKYLKRVVGTEFSPFCHH